MFGKQPEVACGSSARRRVNRVRLRLRHDQLLFAEWVRIAALVCPIYVL